MTINYDGLYLSKKNEFPLPTSPFNVSYYLVNGLIQSDDVEHAMAKKSW